MAWRRSDRGSAIICAPRALTTRTATAISTPSMGQITKFSVSTLQQLSSFVTPLMQLMRRGSCRGGVVPFECTTRRTAPLSSAPIVKFIFLFLIKLLKLRVSNVYVLKQFKFNTCTNYEFHVRTKPGLDHLVSSPSYHHISPQLIHDETHTYASLQVPVIAGGFSQAQKLQFAGFSFKQAGNFKICFCDSTRSNCNEIDDYRIEIGSIRVDEKIYEQHFRVITFKIS